MLTSGKSGAWLGVNGDKRAAEQETTTMHRVRGRVSHGRKRAAEQETTTMHRVRGRVSHGRKRAAEQETTTPPTSYI